jgi:tetratricopeptide (TPR) repeat protein
MKKTILILTMGLWGGWLCAQKIPDCDYNPYQHQREEYIQTIKEFYQEFISTPCNETEAIKLIEEYHKDKQDVQRKEILNRINGMNCDTVFYFLKQQLLSDSSERGKIEWIGLIGCRNPQESVSLFSAIEEKDTSIDVKLKIAFYFCGMGEYAMAINILDKICTTNTMDKCIPIYEFAGESNVARAYYLSEWNKLKPNDDNFGIAMKLAEYGIDDIAFPIIRDTLLYSNNQYRQLSALYGLASIGTEKAFQLIKSFHSNKNTLLANDSKLIFTHIDKKRREKCGK